MSVETDFRGARLMLAAVLLGIAAALGLLIVFFGGDKTNFEDAATFGAQTTSTLTKVGQHPIHCMDSRDSPKMHSYTGTA